MKFPSLLIEHFLAITKAELSLADRGLCLIQGINNDDTSADSNGAGKSTIADSLCWCLYGTTARGVSGDDVINEQAGKDTFVQTTIEDGADTYLVARYRKHKVHKNSLRVHKIEENSVGARTLVDLTKGTDKLTQEVVDTILGCSLDVFRASICAGQEQMPDLPSMTDKHLKLLLEEASGATVLDAAHEEARERTKKAKSAHQEVLTKMAANTAQIANMEATAASLEEAKREWADNHKIRIAAVSAEVREQVGEVQKLKGQVDVSLIEALEAEIAQHQAKIAGSQDERDKLTELQQAAFKAVAEVDHQNRLLTNAQLSLQRTEAARDAASHKIGCPCDSCGRPLTAAELKVTVENAEKAVEDAKIQVQGINIILTAAKQAEVDAQAALKAFQASMTNLSDVATAQAAVQAELSQLKTAQAEIKSKVDSARAAGERLKALTEEANPHEATLAKQRHAIEALRKAHEQMEQAELEAQIEVDHAAAVEAVFSPAGVRAHILDEITPELNAQTAKYLTTLSDGNIQAIWTTLVRDSKGNLKEKFSIEVENAKGAKKFAGLSGGEKRKVRLATALALQDLVATRAIKPIDLYIGDEIDDALDPAGLERLTQILDEKAKDRGTVLIISHNDLSDWLSNIIQIEKMPGGETKITEMTV